MNPDEPCVSILLKVIKKKLKSYDKAHGYVTARALEITYVIYKAPPLPKIKDFSLLPFKTVRPAWTLCLPLL